MAEPRSFLIIGAPKAGTSYLFTLLAQYPGLAQPMRKEVRYFAYDHLYSEGKAWYDACFTWGEGAQLRGEASPLYTMRAQYPRAAERIARDLPDAKLIFLAREPVARAISHYRFFAGRDIVVPPFDRWLDDPRWYNEIIDPSCYFRQLEPYLETFYPERLLVVPFGLLTSNPRLALRRCSEFLGLEAFDARIGDARRNETNSVRRELPAFLRRFDGRSLFRSVPQVLPVGLRRRLRRALSRQVDNAPPSQASQKKLRALLADDTRRFLDLVKGNDQFWSGASG